MKSIIRTVLLLYATSCFASPALSGIRLQVPVSDQGIIIRYDAQGIPSYFVYKNDSYELVSESFLNSVITSTFDKAKKIVCNMKAKPDSISVSLGIFSATWETGKINCKKD